MGKKAPEKLSTTTSTPESHHLFTVRNEGEPNYLIEDQAQDFHRMVEQIMLMSVRERQDLHTAMLFLTAHVNKKDKENWGKLNLVLKYLKGTRELKLTLNVGDMPGVKLWVDALYEVHEDC